MNADQTYSTDDGDAVVTYSRVPARRRSEQAPQRREPTRGASGFAASDPHDAVDASFAAGDLRADRRHPVDGRTEDSERSHWLRYSLIGAALAVVAGAGTLAASVGVATLGPNNGSPDETTSEVAANAPLVEDGSSSATDTVRHIPLNADPSTAEALPEITPPIPRPRPNDVATQVDPAPVGATVAAAPSQQTAPAGDAELTTAATTPPTAAVEPKGQSGGTDGLIISIEETLARIDANEVPAPASTETAPAEIPQLPTVAANEPPAVVMTQPIYPPVTAGDEIGDESDIMPPPFAGGYPSGPVPPEPIPSEPLISGDYPDVPVPPEPVPQAYPHGPYVYPQGPSVYPTAPGAYPPAAADETEARRPGVLRRTFARASVAVGRVLRRNN